MTTVRTAWSAAATSIYIALAVFAASILFLPQHANAAAAYVRANATGQSLSTTLDIGTAGTNRLVMVGAMSEAESATALTSVTVDGKNCIKVLAGYNSAGSGNRTEFWYCDEDNLGSSNGTVTITIAGSGITAANWATHAELFTGVSQNGPYDSGVDSTSLTGTTATVTGIGVPAGGIVIMMAGNGQEGLTATYTSPLTGKTSANPAAGSGDAVSASGIESSAQSNKTYTTTWSGTANRSSAVVVSWGDSSSGSFVHGSITLTQNTTAGSASVLGALSKGSGTFVIDHPLNPKYELLYHSFVESPDVKNIYDGIATLDGSGEAAVVLPDYFLALNKDFRYLATAIGAPMPNLHLSSEVKKRFWIFGAPVLHIAGGIAGGKVSWQVTGIRHDPFIIAKPLIVEVEKGPDAQVDKGQYVCPECYAR